MDILKHRLNKTLEWSDNLTTGIIPSRTNKWRNRTTHLKNCCFNSIMEKIIKRKSKCVRDGDLQHSKRTVFCYCPLK